MTQNRDRNGRRIPQGRLPRLAALGGLATGLLGGMAAEGVRRLAGGERLGLTDLLLTPGNAARFADRLADMRGAAMKIGQLLSMEAGDLLPPELAEILGRLRAEARRMPARQLKQALAAEWGADFMRRFERFDTIPIAAASIGQVHRAMTRDGRDLAIKVQYPGVRDSIDSDVDNVSSLIRLARLAPPGLDLAPLLAEAKRQLHEEADYRREAAQMARFSQLLGEDEVFETPAPQEDLSTGALLAMTYLDGRPIESAVDAPQERRNAIATALIDLVLRELFEFGLMQTDPNFANFQLSKDDLRIQLLDFGASRSVAPSTAEAFRRLLRAALGGSGEDLRAAAIGVGLFTEAAPPRQSDRIVEMMETARRAMLNGAEFDFGASPLLADLREGGMAMALEGAVDHVPPIETLFVQRKLAGLYLLAARLGARVPIRALAARWA